MHGLDRTQLYMVWYYIQGGIPLLGGVFTTEERAKSGKVRLELLNRYAWIVQVEADYLSI